MNKPFAQYTDGNNPPIPVTWPLMFAVLEWGMPYRKLDQDELELMIGLLRENLENAEAICARYYQ